LGSKSDGKAGDVQLLYPQNAYEYVYIYMYILSIEEEIDIRIYLEKNTDTGVKT
jgi:hypothetical protein